MNRPISASEMLSLSVAERIELVEDIWDSIAEAPESLLLTEEEKKILDSRLDSYHKNPAAGSPAINFASDYNILSLFFNFGISGGDAGEKTYYWDDVYWIGAQSTPIF